MSDDAQRVEAVAQLASRLGMRVSALVVGDIKLVFSEPWPGKSEQPAQVHDVEKDKGADPDLQRLRDRAFREFGRHLSDDLVKHLEPVLR